MSSEVSLFTQSAGLQSKSGVSGSLSQCVKLDIQEYLKFYVFPVSYFYFSCAFTNSDIMVVSNEMVTVTATSGFPKPNLIKFTQYRAKQCSLFTPCYFV